jgi:hypothetical protein
LRRDFYPRAPSAIHVRLPHYDNDRTGIALATPAAPPGGALLRRRQRICAAAPRARRIRKRCLSRLNDSLVERRVDAQYVTMVYATWNDEDQTLRSRTPARSSCLSAAAEKSRHPG